jgi:hypothetical protein
MDWFDLIDWLWVLWLISYYGLDREPIELVFVGDALPGGANGT